MFSVLYSQSAAHPLRTNRPSLMTRIASAVSLQRQRNSLARLDDAQLADIGITRAQAEQESSRPCWDAPDHWQR